jgi:hypothetical protein
MQAQARNSIDGLVQAIPRRLTISHFLWACALMPIFILPPLASLAYAVMLMRDRGVPTGVNTEWLAIISLVNIALSLLLLYKLHFSPADVVGFLADFVRSLLRVFFHFNSGQPPEPRLIPT